MRFKLICGAAGIVSLLAIRLPAAEDGRVALHSVKEVAAKNPIDQAVGRAITPVENGQFSSVTVWQFKSGIPSHLHREHDEVIYCTEGEGLARWAARRSK